MGTPIEKIVIVGGGTAGWLTALYLSRVLNRRATRPVTIGLIESRAIGPIGVGEATVPTLRATLGGLGLREEEWMVACQATFKLGINFVGWSCGPAPSQYWHLFREQVPLIEGLPLWHAWLKLWLAGKSGYFGEFCFESAELCAQCRAPRQRGMDSYRGLVTYAYHLDVHLLGAYLREKAVAEGVVHYVDEVMDVTLDEKGTIASVHTRDHGAVAGDLFVDCTGFRGRLINQALGEGFDPFSDFLLCDRALALSVPRDPGQPLRPYTTATAQDAGWVWDIPLYHRHGIGHVYSSHFLSDEEAAKALLKYARNQLGGMGEDGIRPIKMRTGRTRRPWVKNCVAIGLSAGFVEPLESTGIFLIEIGLQRLWESFPDKDFDPSLQERYNAVMARYYEHIRDFLVLHYCLTQRRDTEFWRSVAAECAVPESVREALLQWKRWLPMIGSIPEPRLFAEYSFVSILAGMGHLPDRALPILGHTDPDAIEEGFELIEDRRRMARNQLPDHAAYLQELRSWQHPRLGP